MKAGGWLTRVMAATGGLLYVFVISFMNNGMVTSLIRGLAAFVSFFLFGWLFQVLIGAIMQNQNQENPLSVDTGENSGPGSVTEPELNVNEVLESLPEEDAQKLSDYVKNLLNE